MIQVLLCVWCVAGGIWREGVCPGHVQACSEPSLVAAGHGEGGEGEALASEVQGLGTDRLVKVSGMTDISEEGIAQ